MPDAERIPGSSVRARAHRPGVTEQGGWAGLGVMIIAVVYALLDGGPHRAVLLATAATGALLSAAFALTVGRQPRLRRIRRPATALYALAHVAIVTVLSIVDGGIGSPMSLGFFGTCVFGACSMPVSWIVPLWTANVAGYLVVAEDAGGTHTGIVWVQLAGILATSLACGHQRHQLQRQRRAMAELARIDPLTGALNRRGFDERLRETIAAEPAVALLLLDIDDFKLVNDLRGHAAGDELLVAVVAVLREVCERAAPVARLGGDEFAALLGAERAIALTERVRAELLRRGIAASVGLAVRDPAQDVTALLRAADHDLYARKAARKRRGGVLTGSLSVA